MTPFADRSAGEQEFINQKTRELMVTWCDGSVILGGITHLALVRDSTFPVQPLQPYVDFAISKKWISADGKKILSAGWDTAARFLKR